MNAAEEQIRSATKSCLAQLKIARGDTVFLHSDAIVVAQFPGLPAERRIHCLLDAIEEHLGAEGTLVLPAFTYSFTKDEIFDVRRTPSTVGMITEIFRNRPGVARNSDPIFSVAASGFARDEFAHTAGEECFGANSSFALLHKKNAWITGAGCAFNTTFVHHVEKCFGVDYRFEKIFRGKLIDGSGMVHDCAASYFVRDLGRKTVSNLTQLQHRLCEKGRFHSAEFGRVGAWAVRANDFYEGAFSLLKEDRSALIEEGASG